jgi:hypothetical protein
MFRLLHICTAMTSTFWQVVELVPADDIAVADSPDIQEEVRDTSCSSK